MSTTANDAAAPLSGAPHGNHEVDALVAEQFRAAMAQLATGVVMVTTRIDRRPWGVTVSACCSVSMTPPMLLVGLGAQTASAAAIQEAGSFGVSILGQGTLPAARFGSVRGAPKFVEEFCQGAEEDGNPAVCSALAHADCELDRAVPAGDHVILLGRVRHVTVDGRDDPLLYYDQSYRMLEPAWRSDSLENLV